MLNRIDDRIRSNNNLFWETAQRLYLSPFMERTYGDPRKRELIRKWLRGGRSKSVLIRQLDFHCDPLLIEFLPDSYRIEVLEGEEVSTASLEVAGTHLSIICDSSDVMGCAGAWIRREIRIRRPLSRLRDCYYAARVFLA